MSCIVVLDGPRGTDQQVWPFNYHPVDKEKIMREIEGLLWASPFVLSNCSSVSGYVNTTGMDKNRTCGTEAEMFVLAHKLNTNIYCWHEASRTWNRHGPDHIDTSLTPLPKSNRSMYIYFCVFQVVSFILHID